MNRPLQTVIVLCIIALMALAVWRSCTRGVVTVTTTAPVATPVYRSLAVAGDCAHPTSFAAAARDNASSLNQARWSVFGRPETGWAIYAPLTGHEIGTACAADTPAFAAALAAWRSAHGGPASGTMDAATLDALRLTWLERRPFLAASAPGSCPPAASAAELLTLRPQEGYEGMTIRLRPQALVAWRAMVAAARRESPAIAGDPRLLTIFSGFRDPAADALRCAAGGCGRLTRASCSAHRTGLAMDLYLGSAPGFPPESAADANRLYESQTPAYRWLVANAARFGFVNYPFEPWHWEWAGAQSRPRQP
jgi:hypothetical protein